MELELQIAIIAASVTIVGWVITHFLELRREKRRTAREARARYLERQVEELYGPLFNLTMQIVITNHVRHGLVRVLPADQHGRVDDLLYREYFRPLHQDVRDLLKTRLHLVEGNMLPESFYQYLRHSVQEIVQRDLWNNHQLDTSVVPGIRFPDRFPAEVQETLETLLREYRELLTGLHNSRQQPIRRRSRPKQFSREELA